MTLKHIKQVSTSGSSRRCGEPSWRALRSALSLISVKRFPEIKNIPDKFQVHREYQNIIYFRPCPAKSQFLNLFLRQSCLLIYNFTRQYKVSRQICQRRLPLPPSTYQQPSISQRSQSTSPYSLPHVLSLFPASPPLRLQC